MLVPTSGDSGPRLSRLIAASGGLIPQSAGAGWQVWQVQPEAGRLAIATAGNDAWQLPTDPADVGRHAPPVSVPYSPTTRLLVLAEAPSSAWQAMVGGTDGRGGTLLRSTTAAGMQAFELPITGADVQVSRAPDRRADWLTFELVGLLVVLLAAIPGGRRTIDQQRLRRDADLGHGPAVGAAR